MECVLPAILHAMSVLHGGPHTNINHSTHTQGILSPWGGNIFRLNALFPYVSRKLKGKYISGEAIKAKFGRIRIVHMRHLSRILLLFLFNLYENLLGHTGTADTGFEKIVQN